MRHPVGPERAGFDLGEMPARREPIKTVGTRMVEVEVQTGVIATVKTMVVEDK